VKRKCCDDDVMNNPSFLFHFSPYASSPQGRDTTPLRLKGNFLFSCLLLSTPSAKGKPRLKFPSPPLSLRVTQQAPAVVRIRKKVKVQARENTSLHTVKTTSSNCWEEG
jgi:hypothetical protein